MPEQPYLPRQTRRRNVAFLVNSLNLGGTEQLVVKMSLAIAAEFQVSVICLDELGIWAQELRQSNIPVYCFYRQPGIDLAMALHIARFCRRHRIDIIHAHQSTPWFYAALARFLWGRPRLLLEEHGRHYPEKDSFKKRLFNRIFIQPMTHRMIAVSDDVKKRLAHYEGVDPEKIEVIYNGVHAQPSLSDAQKRKLRADLGFSEKDFIVGYVGRFDKIKNLPLLVKSLAQCRNTCPEIKGLLIGDGPVFGQIGCLVNESGISEAIRLTGYKQDAPRIVQCMDLFVLPSFSEGTSLALLEALAAGVPVAVSDVGGNPEIIRSGKSGWVFASDSINDLSACIIDALRSPRKAMEYARIGMGRYQQFFSFDVMMRRYKETYLELLTR